jgi:hypothetical protein
MKAAGVRRALVAIACAAGGEARAQQDPVPVEVADVYDEATSHPVFEDFAPRIFVAPPRATLRPDTRGPAFRRAAGGRARAWPLLYRDDRLTVNGSLAATVGAFSFRNNQFAPAPSQVSQSFRDNPGWGELFVEPGITAQWRLSPSTSVYGGIAYMETATQGTDYDGYRQTRGTATSSSCMRARAGKTMRASCSSTFRTGTEPRARTKLPHRCGSEQRRQRGANFLGPRTAWANAAIAKATIGDVSAQAFWLKPNDATSADTGTRITGVEIAWDRDGPLRGAALYMYVPDSSIATRDGLNVYDVRMRWHPLASAPNAWLQGEYAWQRKSGVAARGWYAALNYNAKDAWLQPLAMLRYAWFAGDKPGTSKWEGFDSLYFGGGNPDWYQGKLASTIFNNTNLASVAASITLTPVERNLVQVVALAFRAVEANAPLAVPEPNQPVTSGGGVRPGRWRPRSTSYGRTPQQAGQRERVRRVRSSGRGLQGSLREPGRQHARLERIRSAGQCQLLTRRSKADARAGTCAIA